MPKLSKTEIQARARLFEQALRIANGGVSTEKQLKAQLRALHTLAMSANPPRTADLEKTAAAIRDQLDSLADDAQRDALDAYLQAAKQWLSVEPRSGQGQVGQPSHLSLPLLVKLCRAPDQLFQELACMLSEMGSTYQPVVFVTTLMEAIKRYHVLSDQAGDFPERLKNACEETEARRHDLAQLYLNEALSDLHHQLQAAIGEKLMDSEGQEKRSNRLGREMLFKTMLTCFEKLEATFVTDQVRTSTSAEQRESNTLSTEHVKRVLGLAEATQERDQLDLLSSSETSELLEEIETAPPTRSAP